MATRREVIEAISARYHAAARPGKKAILDEFIEVTGFHRKHAIRTLRKTMLKGFGDKSVPRARVYKLAVVEALTILWEAADRICGKRLKEAIPALLCAMERHGYLNLDPEVRPLLVAMSAATIDRLLAPIRKESQTGRRRNGISTPLRKSIAVRTFNDWNDPPPGYFEMDMVAHCGKSVAGSHVHSLVLTDIASGWTVAAAMVVREQTLVIVTVDEIRRRLPFPVLGLDVDNDSAFINEALVGYCKQHGIELTRSRAYKKNDQAWIEQKNGAVVRRLVGYGRLEGVQAAEILTKLHESARLYVNFFLPSFKLQTKTRAGAKFTRKYDKPATPYARLISSEKTSGPQKQQLEQTYSELDPIALLSEIRAAQQDLRRMEVGGTVEPVADQHLDLFVGSLKTAWKQGEVRPTHRKISPGPRSWRTRADPFESCWPTVEKWLNEQPDITAKLLLQRLQESATEQFDAGRLRTLQRRVKQWRTEIARRLVLGVPLEGNGMDTESENQKDKGSSQMGALPPNPRDLTLSGRHLEHGAVIADRSRDART